MNQNSSFESSDFLNNLIFKFHPVDTFDIFTPLCNQMTNWENTSTIYQGVNGPYLENLQISKKKHKNIGKRYKLAGIK